MASDDVEAAEKLLPAWFVPRMMTDEWVFGLLLVTGQVLAIFAQPLKKVKSRKITTSAGLKGRLVAKVEALDCWRVVFLHVLPGYPGPALRFIEDFHQCRQVDFAPLVELEAAKQIDVLPGDRRYPFEARCIAAKSFHRSPPICFTRAEIGEL
jgi:hypothetical protein